MTKMEWSGSPPASPEPQKVTVAKKEAVKVSVRDPEPVKPEVIQK
jgi:hypothetical protein